MSYKAVISLATGLEDSEKVTVGFFVSVGAAEKGRPALMFLTKGAVRPARSLVSLIPLRAMVARGLPISWAGMVRLAAASWYARSASTHARSTRATSCPTLQ